MYFTRFAYTLEPMTNQELDTLIERWRPGFQNVGGRMKRLLRAAIAPGATVLDVGCGRETFYGEAYAAAGRVVGVDHDEYATENPLMQAVYITKDDTLPFGDAEFDVVTCQWVMEYVEHPETFAREIARVLKPGGRFVFMTPNARSPFVIATRALPLFLKRFLRSVFLDFAEDETFPTFYRLNSPEQIERTFGAAGLTREELQSIDCYDYFRFSRLAVLFSLAFYASINKIAPGREHHLAGDFVKR